MHQENRRFGAVLVPSNWRDVMDGRYDKSSKRQFAFRIIYQRSSVCRWEWNKMKTNSHKECIASELHTQPEACELRNVASLEECACIA